MSQSFDATLTLELKRSPSLLAAVTAMHVGALIIAIVVPATPLLRAGLIGAVVASAAYTAIRHTVLGEWSGLAKRLGGARVGAIEWDTADRWAIRHADSRTWRACDLRDCWRHTHLVILHLRRSDDAKSLRVLIPADAVAPEAFRRLRARLQVQTAVAPR